MTGILILSDDRPDIIFDNGTCYGGLHCGECFEIYLDHWVRVRLEHWNDWILIYEGKPYPLSRGIIVKI